MDIMQLGAIGELVGGVAVIGSLIYVGVQVRHGNFLAKEAALREGRRITDEFLRDLSTDETLSSFYFRGLANRDDLSPDERLRFDMILLRIFRLMEAMVLEQFDRPMREELWTPNARTFGAIIRQPGAIASWQRQRPLFTDRFAGWVDQTFPREA